MRPLFVVGTRPEIIKLSPVIRECETRGIDYWCYFTGQHDVRALAHYLEASRGTFGEHVSLSPARQVGRYMAGIECELERSACDLVVAQGDTFSVSAAAQVAFYGKKPFVHVEAGLRTYEFRCPWPEEYHRHLVSIGAALHCCPTNRAAQNIYLWPGGPVVVTGNTVVDSLLWAVEQEGDEVDAVTEIRNDHGQIDQGMVLVTCHRRENQGGGISRVCQAVCTLAEKFPSVGFLWAAHPSPAVQEEMRQHASWPSNVMIPGPLNYPAMVRALKSCTLVITDSGGLQEEAPTFSKPVVILRNETERQELIEANGGILVGTNVDKIVDVTSRLLSDGFFYAQHQVEQNPFGDGHAAERIVCAMLGRFA